MKTPDEYYDALDMENKRKSIEREFGKNFSNVIVGISKLKMLTKMSDMYKQISAVIKSFLCLGTFAGAFMASSVSTECMSNKDSALMIFAISMVLLAITVGCAINHTRFMHDMEEIIDRDSNEFLAKTLVSMAECLERREISLTSGFQMFNHTLDLMKKMLNRGMPISQKKFQPHVDRVMRAFREYRKEYDVFKDIDMVTVEICKFKKIETSEE